MTPPKNLLLGQGIRLTVAAVMVALVSFLKEAIFARYFGVSYISDAYTIAIQVPEILFAIVWDTIGVAVVPLYTKKLHIEGKKAAQKFFSNILTLVVLFSILFIIAGEFLGVFIIKFLFPGLSSQVCNLAVSILRWVFPALLFEGIVRVVTGILNVHKQFFVPKVINTARNASIIVFLFLFAKKFGVYSAVVGFLTGMILESVLSLFAVHKYERYIPKVDLKDPALKTVITMAVPLLLSVGIQDINQIADKAIASFLEAGSIASLNYASKLSGMIKATIMSSIVVLLYPRYSKLAAENRNEELALEYSKSVSICILLGMPLILGGLFLKQEIVSIAFEGGYFDHASVLSVSRLFAVYLVGLVFSTITSVTVKLFAACCDTKTPAINAAIGVVVNIVLNIILSYCFGTIGLAAATTFAAMTISTRLFFLVRKKVHKFSLKPIIVVLLKSVISGFIMFAGLQIFKDLAMDTLLAISFGGQLIYSMLSVLLGVSIYAALLMLTQTLKKDFSLKAFEK